MSFDLTSYALLMLGGGLFATFLWDLLVVLFRCLGVYAILGCKFAAIGLFGGWLEALIDLLIEGAFWLGRRGLLLLGR